MSMLRTALVGGAWLTALVGWALALPYVALVVLVSRERPRRRRQRGGRMMTSGSSTTPPSR